MTVKTSALSFRTSGKADMVDITAAAQQAVEASELQAGILTLFVPGSTAALTTIEYERGVLQDFERLFDAVAPANQPYAHDAQWGDGNGYSHVRAALLGSSLTIPFSEGRLLLGTWQQIILVDFDNRSRTRQVITQVMGE